MVYISKLTRDKVSKRADYCCEYCLIPERLSFFKYQVEHIISVKHNGGDELSNLAYACPICNRNKGTDLGTIIGEPPSLVRFYNPRVDDWNDHFVLKSNGEILSTSSIGKATINILKLNHEDATLQRVKLIGSGKLKR